MIAFLVAAFSVSLDGFGAGPEQSSAAARRLDALRPASPCRRDEVAGLIQQLSYLRVA